MMHFFESPSESKILTKLFDGYNRLLEKLAAALYPTSEKGQAIFQIIVWTFSAILVLGLLLCIPGLIAMVFPAYSGIISWLSILLLAILLSCGFATWLFGLGNHR